MEVFSIQCHTHSATILVSNLTHCPRFESAFNQDFISAVKTGKVPKSMDVKNVPLKLLKQVLDMCSKWMNIFMKTSELVAQLVRVSSLGL